MPISPFRPTLLASVLSALLVSSSYASVVRNDVDYQYFRDFAENKGVFSVGASNIAIYNKQGVQIGTALPNLPMLDLRVANRRSAIATLVQPQYIASVAHNSGYGSVQFGNESANPDENAFSYQLVARNKQGTYDYHVPRLHKLVTEIAPIAVSSVPYHSGNPKDDAYMDRERFPYFVRTGSGTQGVRDRENNRTHLSGAYYYQVGGEPLTIDNTKNYWLGSKGSVFDSPLAAYAMAGDSGSPLFAFDRHENRWVMVGVLSTYAGPEGSANIYIASRPDFIQKMQAEDEISLHNQSAFLSWQAKGSHSQIRPNAAELRQRLWQTRQSALNVPLRDPSLISQDNGTERPSMENGKSLHIYGQSGTLQLENHIDQGAGALYFHTDFTVRGAQTAQTWQGAGVSVDKDKVVHWQVHNPAGDRLSKIGAGTLYVNGQGENQGDISVGDGTVVLAQRADNGKKQAFQHLGIVSGRATVILNDAEQVKPDNIHFGFRGGRLDLNGNRLAFQYIQNADEGARLVNHNARLGAEITISGSPRHQAQDIDWKKWGEESQKNLTLYEYDNPYQGHRTDYFVLKNEGNPSTYFPTDGSSNHSWEFISTDRNTAVQTLLERHNTPLKTRTFSGYLGETDPHKTNGALSVHFRPADGDNLLMLNGGTQLNGTLSVARGKLLLSGRPVPHARDMLKEQDVVFDNEWINRQFQAKEFRAEQGGVLVSGRNVSRLQGNFVATDNARLHLGFIPRRTVSCVRSDYSGNTECNWQAVLSAENFANLPTTQIWGNVELRDQSRLVVGKSHLHGNIQGDSQTRVNLTPNSQWTLNGDSRIGNLLMEGSELTLNSQFEGAQSRQANVQFNRLTIDNELDGSGKIRYLSNAAEGKSDQIVVNGTAMGNFVLALKNTGREPNAISPLTLFSAKNFGKNHRTFHLALENGYVDLGAYRYILAKQQNSYRLYNPLKDAEVNAPNDPIYQAQQQYAQIQAEIQRQQTAVDQLNQQYQTSQNSLQPLQTQLQQAQKRFAQLEHNVKRSPYHKRLRAPASYHQLVNQMNKQRALVQRLQAQLQQTSGQQQQQLQALEQAENQLQQSQQQLQKLNRQEVLAQAQQLCMQQQLSAELCHKVAFNANEAALTPTEFLLSEQQQAVSAAENALQQAQQSGDQTAIAQAQQRLSQARAQEQAAQLALQQENADLLQGIAQARQASLAPTAYRQADVISRYANSALSELSASTNAALQIGQNLDRQLLNGKLNGVWLNQQWQKHRHSNATHRPYEQQLNLTQIGVAQALQPNLSVGALFSHSRAHSSFDQQVSGKGNLSSLSLFVKKGWDNGVFASLDGSIGRGNSQLELDGERVKFQRNLFSLGANLGKQWDLAGWKVQPSVGVRYYRLSGVSYELAQAKISHSALNLVAYTAGIRLSHAFELNGVRLEPSFASYYQDASHQKLRTQSAMQVNQQTMQQSFGRYVNHEASLALRHQQWQFSATLGVQQQRDSRQQKYAALMLGYGWK